MGGHFLGLLKIRILRWSKHEASYSLLLSSQSFGKGCIILSLLLVKTKKKKKKVLVPFSLYSPHTFLPKSLHDWQIYTIYKGRCCSILKTSMKVSCISFCFLHQEWSTGEETLNKPVSLNRLLQI